MKKAVLFIIFNRPDTTQKVFNAIREAKPPRFYIASDASRPEKEGEFEEVEKARRLVLDNIDWKCEVKTLFRDKNLGCRDSVSSAVTWFFENEKDGIILEDDCLPNQSFFSFCEELLEYYSDNKKIMHIAGHRFAPNFKDNSSYFFTKIQHCWGWATWADRWQYYGIDLKNFDKENLKKISQNQNVQKYWEDILDRTQNNDINSWAYQWALKIVENDGLCINPSLNLISNIGFGEKGTHTIDSDNPFANLSTYEIKKIIHPLKIEIDQKAVDYIYQDHYGINFSQIELDQINNKLNLKENELNSTKLQLDLTKTELNSTKLQLDSRVNELSSIYSSRGWRLIYLFRKYLYKIFPNDRLRKKVITIIFSSLKKIAKLIRKVFGKTIGLFLLIKNYLLRFKPKKKRNINYNSKKIVYVGHSYHNKTKSTSFLIDYFKKYFDVEVISDTSWEDNKPLDLSFIDNSYLGVVFFQLLPPNEVLKNINNDNIIFFPMYDGVRQDYQFWNGLRDLKIINFSKTLHNKLKKWGMDSMYVQYFPEPKDFIPGDKHKIFFWQRLTHININTILRLFKKEKIQIHLHKAVDPWQEFVEPTKDQEKDFNITYSDWFPNKEDMSNLIKEKGIYIAPREYEGIGMSFLEAMAMGKAVVAVDNPTMNEYIKDGVNGYLFNLKNSRKLDLSNIDEIQKNAYEYICNGYKKWEKNKESIINFLKKI